MESALRRLRSPVVSTAIVFVGLRMGDALSLLNSIVLGRWLPPIEFGQANAVLTALAVPAVAIGVVVCREAVWLSETQTYDALLRRAWRWFMVLACIGVGCGVMVMVYGSLFQSIFRFEHASIRYAIALTVAVTIAFPLWSGILQGQQRFVVLSMGPLLQGSVRIIASMALIYTGFKVAGAVVAPALAMVAVMLWCMVWAHRRPLDAAMTQRPVASLPVRPSMFAMFVNDLIPLTAMTALLSIDVVVVNRLLPADTGGFAAISTIGKLTFYVPQGIVITLLPYVMRNSLLGRTSRRYLLASVAATAVVSAAIVWLLYAWHAQIMQVYNPVFSRHAGYMPRYTVAMALFSIVTITTNYAMARGMRLIGFYLLALIPVQIYLYYTAHGTLQSLIDRTVVVAFLAMAGSLLLLVLHKEKKRSNGVGGGA